MTPVSVQVEINKIEPASPYRNIGCQQSLRGTSNQSPQHGTSRPDRCYQGGTRNSLQVWRPDFQNYRRHSQATYLIRQDGKDR